MQMVLHNYMNEINPRRLAELLRTKMTATGVTQCQLEESTGIHQSQISRILQGRFKQASKNVLSLCKFLGIDASPPLRSSPRLERAVCNLWDGTPRHETVLLRLIEAVSQVGI